MTPKEHAEYISQRAAHALKSKYMRGDAEHGGRLWRKATLDHIEDEILDLIVYYYNHRDHVEHIKDLLHRALDERHDQYRVEKHLTEALNILEFGNPEGVREEERDG